MWDGFTADQFTSASFADPNQEVPVTFRNVWFSYAIDWARLNSFGQVDKNNNWLLASLGWPNHGLATMGGVVWDFSPLGAGAPLANLMQRGWRNEGFIDFVGRFQSILGDPTLRLHRVSPVTYLTGSRVGSSATLNWNSSLDPVAVTTSIAVLRAWVALGFF